MTTKTKFALFIFAFIVFQYGVLSSIKPHNSFMKYVIQHTYYYDEKKEGLENADMNDLNKIRYKDVISLNDNDKKIVRLEIEFKHTDVFCVRSLEEYNKEKEKQNG